jgi:hypothetical protein
MPNQLLDKGVERNPNPTINPDFKRGFLDSVRNSQPRLALNYLIDILNEMNEEIVALKDKVDTLYGGEADVKSDDDAYGVAEDYVEEEAPKPKATSRRATKPAPEKEDADGEEV